jgi:hypothetical protein
MAGNGMNNATQYQYELVEIARMLLAKQGIKEGRWTLGVGFAISAAHAGPSPDAVRPSMVVSVDKIMLSRAEPNTPEQLVIDASVPE